MKRASLKHVLVQARTWKYLKVKCITMMASLGAQVFRTEQRKKESRLQVRKKTWKPRMITISLKGFLFAAFITPKKKGKGESKLEEKVKQTEDCYMTTGRTSEDTKRNEKLKVRRIFDFKWCCSLERQHEKRKQC